MAKKNWTLEKLASWIGASVLTVLFVPMGVYFTLTSIWTAEACLAERGEGMAQAFSMEIVTPLLLDDRVTLQEFLHKARSTDTALHYVCILNREGKVVAFTCENRCPRELEEIWKTSRIDRARFRSEREPMMDIPVPLLDGELGTLHLGLSRSRAVTSAYNMLIILGIIFFCTLAVHFIGTHLIARKVSRPLRELEETLSKYPEKDTGILDISISGTHEVKSLGKSFSAMTRRVHSLEREKEANRAHMAQAKRLAAVGELAAGLAHEIHNPLDGLLESLRFLDVDPEKSERAAKYYPMIREGLQRIASAMQGMLTFARSGQRVTIESCPLQEIINHLELLVKANLKNRRVKLILENPGNCICLCDKVGLSQAVLNLVLNAAEAAEESKNQQVRIQATCDEEWSYLLVDDSGPGVPAELGEKIFEPFFSTKPKGRGTGLGLSVSRQLIRAADGEIVLAKGPGPLGGARFIIRLRKCSTEGCKNGEAHC